jgi:hypothetical protein
MSSDSSDEDMAAAYGLGACQLADAASLTSRDSDKKKDHAASKEDQAASSDGESDDDDDDDDDADQDMNDISSNDLDERAIERADFVGGMHEHPDGFLYDMLLGDIMNSYIHEDSAKDGSKVIPCGLLVCAWHAMPVTGQSHPSEEPGWSSSR